MIRNLLCLILLSLMLQSCAAVDNQFLYTLGTVTGSQAFSIDVVNGDVLVRNQNQIWLYSTFNAWQPRIEASFTSLYPIEDVNFQGGNYIYISSQEPTNIISSVDSLNQFGKIYFTRSLIGDRVTREGATLYVADRYRGIDIINIGSGGAQDLLANFSEKWGVRDFVAKYPYIYALNDFGLVTVDISNLSFPVSIATNYQINNATKLVQDGDILYVAAEKNLLVLSVRDVNKPTLINQFRLFDNIQALAIKDKRLFISQGRNGVKIFDISNPLKLEDLHTFYPPFPVYDIALENDFVYVAMGRDGWMIYEYR